MSQSGNANARKITNFLLTFTVFIITGFILLWLFPIDEQFSQIAIPGIFFGAFIFGLISASSTK